MRRLRSPSRSLVQQLLHRLGPGTDTRWISGSVFNKIYREKARTIASSAGAELNQVGVFTKQLVFLNTVRLLYGMPKNSIPVAILVRVSTSKQETARQLHELTQYAEGKGYSIVEICSETISGDSTHDQRLALHRVEELAAAGTIKKVLVHEISRIALRNSVAHKFVETLENYGVSLYWHAQGIETLLPTGKRNPAAGIMLALLAEMGRNELETLKARIASGLATARRNGKTLGRPKGTALNRAAFLKKHGDIVRLLKGGQSVRNAAKIADKGGSTVQRVKAMLTA